MDIAKEQNNSFKRNNELLKIVEEIVRLVNAKATSEYADILLYYEEYCKQNDGEDFLSLGQVPARKDKVRELLVKSSSLSNPEHKKLVQGLLTRKKTPSLDQYLRASVIVLVAETTNTRFQEIIERSDGEVEYVANKFNSVYRSKGKKVPKKDLTVTDKPLSLQDDRDIKQKLLDNESGMMNVLNFTMRKSLEQRHKKCQNIRRAGQVFQKNLVTNLRTLHNMAFNLGQRNAMIRAGIKKYQIVAILDERTTDFCRGMNGKIYKVSEAELHVTIPPFHYRCRTTIVAVV